MSEKTGKKKSKKKTEEDDDEDTGGKSSAKFLVIVGIALLVVAGVGGGAYYAGLVHSIMGWERPNHKAEVEISKPVMHPLPQIRTDMKTGECKAPFLRAQVDVQLAPEDLPRLQEAQDRIMDGILAHLRDQERQNVVGKAGTERLRFELVQIIDNVIRPAKVHTILFKELIVQ